jgi:O-antigen ligase
MNTGTHSHLHDSDIGFNSWLSRFVLGLACIVIAFAAAFVPSGTLLIGVAVIALLCCVAVSRNGFIALLLTSAAFEAMIRPYGTYSLVRYAIFSAIAASIYLYIYFHKERFEFPPSRLLLPFVIFAVWLIIRTVSAVSPEQGFQAAVVFISSAVVYSLTYQLQDSPRRFRTLLFVQTGIAFAYFVVAMAFHISQGGARLGILTVNPNVIGNFAYVTAALGLFAFRYHRNRVHKTLSAIQVAAMLYVLILAGSRASMLALLVFVGVFIWLIGHRKLAIAGLAAVVLSLLIVIGSKYSSGVFHNMGVMLRVSSGFSSRMILWESALQLIGDHSVIGVGAGSVSEIYSDYVRMTDPRVAAYSHGAVGAGNVHNGVLNLTAQFGLIGLALVVWGLLAFFRYMLAVRKKHSSNGETVLLSSYLIASVLAMLTRSVFESSLPYGIFILEFPLAVFAAASLRQLVTATEGGSAEGISSVTSGR